MTKEIAIFAMGCFWKPDLLFSKIKGVEKTEVGFMGGKEKYKNPSYVLVCTGITGHAEVVQITFNNKKVSFKKLLDVFWKNHNPTTKNRQGLDIGAQYRSAIFFHSEKQEKEAEDSLKEAQKKFDRPIVTEITKAREFYIAEEYHQKYLEKRGLQSCEI